MPAPGPDDHQPLRLTVAGIGSTVRLTLEGSRAPELRDHLTRAWSRSLLPSEDAPDATEPGPSGTPAVPGSTADARPAGVPFRRGGDTRPEPHHPLPELLVTLDPAPVPPAEGRVSGSDADTLLVQTTQAITRQLIESQTGRLLMLHAGAVAHPQTGRAVVLVAPGGTGKTTLVRTLADRYGYLSDETVAIDADYRVLPYQKPLSVRRPQAPKQELSPDDLGLLPAPAEPTVARLCLLDRREGVAEPEITELGLLDAITELTPQTSALYALPEGLRTLARLIQATGPVLRLRYTEADDLVPFFADLLDGTDAPTRRHPGPEPASPDDATSESAGPQPLPHPEPEPDPGSPDDHGAAADRRPTATPDPGLRIHAHRFADTLEREGEALILLSEGGLLRLNPLGASIVEFSINPIRLDDLAAALERRFGAPDDGDLLEFTAQRVRELADQGVLALGGPPLPDAPGPYWRIGDDTAYTVSAPDRVVVFNLATPAEQPQALVGTAAAIWQFLLGDDDNPRPWTGEPDLIADLAEAYAIEPSAIIPDVRAFLTRMHATGHLESRASN
ncbi:MAG: hypothetical protein KIT69_03990 [Propionibacteriaceae bacterium]|nr:hypothetical protein [Propionibacteriaceae bacterium]